MKQYRFSSVGRKIRESYNALLKAWGIPYEELPVPTPYGDTHVIAAGDPSLPPLMLFHGVGDDSALMWIYNARALSASFRIYAVDTIGGPGKSVMGARYDKTFSDEKWISAIIDGLGIERAYFAGVSHGAYLSQLAVISIPERVIKAVAISSSVAAGSGSPMKTMMKIFMPEALIPTKRNAVKLLQKLSGDHSEVFTDNPLILNHYRLLLKGFNNMAMAYHRVRGFTEDEIAAVREKTLFLVGGKDPFQTMGGRELLTQYNMNARFFEDAGHGLNHEKAEEVDRIIIEYLLG